MAASQDIFLVRCKYNQWAAKQTVEDFAPRYTARSPRQWGILPLAMAALSSTWFLALEAIGGTVALQYGFLNAVSAMGVVCVAIFVIGLPICINATRAGVDIDLFTRGAIFATWVQPLPRQGVQ